MSKKVEKKFLDFTFQDYGDGSGWVVHYGSTGEYGARSSVISKWGIKKGKLSELKRLHRWIGSVIEYIENNNKAKGKIATKRFGKRLTRS